MPKFLQDYIDGFLRCYPHKTIHIRPRNQRDRTIKYQVYINGEAGEFALSEDQVRSATRGFNAGR